MTKLNTIICEEIMTEPLKPIEFVVDNIITQGLFILVGAPKIGKSWLALDIRLSVAKGEPVLNAKTTKGTWEQAQCLLKQRSEIKPRSNGGRKLHRYSRLIKCAECGSHFVAKTRTWRGKEYVEYTCNRNHRYGKEYCTPHRIHESQLDYLVFGEVQNLKDGVRDIRELLLQLRDAGKAMIVASHNSVDVDMLCDRVFEIAKGDLAQVR